MLYQNYCRINIRSEIATMNSNNQKNYDCIVIGAGISGISFATSLKDKGQNILIIEKENRIGGHIQSYKSKTDNNFWFELGAHTCYNSYTSLLNILPDKEIVQELGKGSYITYKDGKLKSIASQVNYLSMLTHFFRYFTADRTGKTVQEYFTPIVGKKNYDKLFSRAFRAVICQPADLYPADLFLKRRNGRNEDYPRKFSFKGGISSFLQSLVESLDIQVQYNTSITEITKSDSGEYILKTNGGESITTKRIAFATDSNTTSLLLKKVEPSISNLLSTIEMSKSTTIAIVVKIDACKIKPIAGIIPVSDKFMSVVTRDLIDHDNLRAFIFHFMGDDATFEDKKSEICQILGIQPSDIIEYTSMQHSLPSLRKNHLEMEKQIENARTDNNIYIVGNYFYGLSLEDCVNRAMDETERYQ